MPAQSAKHGCDKGALKWETNAVGQIPIVLGAHEA